jgi:hypothetical protein
MEQKLMGTARQKANRSIKIKPQKSKAEKTTDSMKNKTSINLRIPKKKFGQF